MRIFIVNVTSKFSSEKYEALEMLQNGFKCLGLGTHLFVKVPRPGDSDGTFSVFESSCHLLLPV